MVNLFDKKTQLSHTFLYLSLTIKILRKMEKKLNVPTEQELFSLEEEERRVAEMLNLLELSLGISENLRDGGKPEYADDLEKEIVVIGVFLFNDASDITEEEMGEKAKKSIREIEKLAKILEEGIDIENGILLNKVFKGLLELIFGFDFHKEWDKTFELCYEIAIKNGDTQLANEIKKYIGIPKDQELGEDFILLLKRCIDIIINNK